MKHLNKNRAFSLLELLAVVVVIIALMALIVPGVSGMATGLRMTQAAGWIVDEINNARTASTARNKPVELWVIETSPPSAKSSAYRTLAARILNADGSASWIAPFRNLPTGIIISPSATKSNLIGEQTPQTVPDTPGSLKGVAVRFYPNGQVEPVNPSGNLNLGDPLFMTVESENEVENPNGDLPSNFITVQIEPLNGRVTSFRR